VLSICRFADVWLAVCSQFRRAVAPRSHATLRCLNLPLNLLLCNVQEYCARNKIDVNALMPETYVFQFDSEIRVDR